MIPHLSALRVHNFLLYLAGALTVLAAYTNNFATCAIYAGLCGFAIGKKISFDRNSSLINLFQHLIWLFYPVLFAMLLDLIDIQQLLVFCSSSVV